MHAALLFNPISGAGKGRRTAETLKKRLEHDGHRVSLASTEIHDPAEWLAPILQDTQPDCLVVIGGDGAIRLAGGTAADFQIPIYHYPSGTENLFARQFDMTADPDQLAHALADPSFETVDLGTVNGVEFVLMVGVGYDAQTVHSLDATRSGGISHMSYFWPMFRNLVRWNPPVVEVTVDGMRIDDGGPAMVLVANCRHYAGGLDPAWQASMTDGLLDIVYMPARTRAELLWRLARYRLRHHAHDAAARYLTGRAVRVRNASGFHAQVDGDPPRHLEMDNGMLRDVHITLSEKKLRVIVPRLNPGG